MTAGALVLKVAGSEVPPGEWKVTDTPREIGRLPSADVTLVHSSVSRNHARISPTGDGFVIEDLGSMNGTWLNDVRVSGRVPLTNGDLVLIGDVALRVEVDSAPAPPPPQPTLAPVADEHPTVYATVDDIFSSSSPPTPVPQPRAPMPQPPPPLPVTPVPKPPVGAAPAPDPAQHERLERALERFERALQRLERAPERGPDAAPAAGAAGDASAAGLVASAERHVALLRKFQVDLGTALWSFEEAGGRAAVQAFFDQIQRTQENPRSAKERNGLLEHSQTAAQLLQAALTLIDAVSSRPATSAPVIAPKPITLPEPDLAEPDPEPAAAPPSPFTGTPAAAISSSSLPPSRPQPASPSRVATARSSPDATAAPPSPQVASSSQPAQPASPSPVGTAHSAGEASAASPSPSAANTARPAQPASPSSAGESRTPTPTNPPNALKEEPVGDETGVFQPMPDPSDLTVDC